MENELNFEQVQQYIEANKETEEVSNYLGQYSKLDTEKIESYLGSDEGRSITDKLNNKFLSSYTKEGGGQSRAFESMLKAKREEWEKESGIKLTPEQEQIKELTEKWEKSENEKFRSELTSKAINSLQYKDLGPMAHMFVGSNEEETMANVTMLNDFFKNFIDLEVGNRLKDQSGRDNIGGNKTAEGNSLEIAVKNAYDKALKTGKREDRVEYKKIKAQFEAEKGGK